MANPRQLFSGSGPAGFYTSYKVMSKIEHAIVDMYERLPVPFGLVRFGVAPDHPEVKNCQDKFTEVATSPSFNYIGNIDVGKDLPLSLLKPHYDAILFAYGAFKDRRLGVPGEDTLSGIFSARAFVGWYNGLPEYADLRPDLSVGEEAVIIGQGNVALDVARTLLSDVDRLRTTDMTEQALEALSKSRIRRVRVVGRRGPMQASFTIKEIRELFNLRSVGFIPIDPSLFPSTSTKLARTPRRLTQLLSKGSSDPLSNSEKIWSLDFLLAPKSFNAFTGLPDQLSSVTFSQTALQGPDPFDASAKIVTTQEQVSLPASIAFRSIGYRSEPIQGMEELGIPFDEGLGIIPNDLYGRILSSSSGSGERAATHVPGMYCAGWVKTGPTGVIASTMADAFSTADVIARDWEERALFLNGTTVSDGKMATGWDSLREEVERRGLRRVDWNDWEAIDMAERENGTRRGKDREKFSTVEEMLNVLR
ncbi:nadph-adrenodoxin reductase [Lasallia pustulata]|uniref:NADPH:adrenodoxin oxidoreductase, mitochondrial n=1 Tax=Lasallia pustulata TaxID=136370 RepID=A0A1W5CVG9_9LECA|nr:nadph-adrenodoxin reductase [Lasallia pustulata]